jgi:hypothetical protein
MLDSKTTEELNEVATPEITRGPSGIVGQPTPSLTIKQRWHEEHFNVEDVNDRKNPRKQAWVPKHSNIPSLKRYARQLATSGNETAQAWFANKGGKLNAKRNDKNQARVASERTASKASRKKGSK